MNKKSDNRGPADGIFTRLIQYLPAWAQGPVWHLLDIAGVIIFFQGLLSLLFGFDVVRLFGKFIAESTPQAAEFLVGFVVDTLVNMVIFWRGVVHPPFLYLFNILGLDFPDYLIDVGVVVSFFLVNQWKVWSIKRKIPKSRQAAKKILKDIEAAEEYLRRIKDSKDLMDLWSVEFELNKFLKKHDLGQRSIAYDGDFLDGMYTRESAIQKYLDHFNNAFYELRIKSEEDLRRLEKLRKKLRFWRHLIRISLLLVGSATLVDLLT